MKIALDSLGPMVAIEQRMLKSKREKICADCGDPGTVKQEPGRFFAGVGHYWFCDWCHNYWEAQKP